MNYLLDIQFFGGRGSKAVTKPKLTKSEKYKQYLNSLKDKDRQFFFGDYEMKSNKYFTFDRVKDDDNIVIITDNITTIKDNPVLIVGENQAVYLKDWQVRPVMNYDENIYGFAVKLNRNYFKPYTFRNNFEKFAFDGRKDDFDALLKVAKEQQKENLKIAQGWGKAEVQWNAYYRKK